MSLQALSLKAPQNCVSRSPRRGCVGAWFISVRSRGSRPLLLSSGLGAGRSCRCDRISWMNRLERSNERNEQLSCDVQDRTDTVFYEACIARRYG